MTHIIWALTDEKPGHKNQLLGLCHALEKQHEVETHWFNINDRSFSFSALRQRCQIEKPSIVIGAGHKTHKSLLFCKLFLRLKTIVLMRPSLPLSWFDLCFIPQHDKPKEGLHVEKTLGAINTVSPSKTHTKNTGVILIGGESKHFSWDSQSVLDQVQSLINNQADIQWKITSSRRTPSHLITKLNALKGQNNQFIAHTDTPDNWVKETLSSVEIAWCSMDSVSMIYEALTAGCKVGLMSLEPKKNGRIADNINHLLSQGYCTSFEQWQTSNEMPPPQAFDEATRCAEIVVKRFLNA